MARGTSKEDRAAEKAARQQESVTRRKRAALKKRAMNVAVIALLAGAVRLNGPKTTDLRFGNVDGLNYWRMLLRSPEATSRTP